MEKKNFRFKLIDTVYLIMAALPIVFGIILQVLTKPASEGISIVGARIYFTIPMPLQDFPVTEAQINSWLVMISILFVCLYLTHGMSTHIKLKRQHFAELAVQKVESLVKENMGEYFKGFVPFVIAVLALSAFSSLLSLFGLFPPTSDINVVGGWAILVFFLITHYKLKGGLPNYLKGFTEPVAVLTPINIVSELATPVSMAFRHYGNVLSGTVISVLIGSGLAGISSVILGWLPGFLADIPLLQVGLPAILSIYFDVFSGCLQAFIFAMLTMVYVAGGFSQDEYEKRKLKKQKIKLHKTEEF